MSFHQYIVRTEEALWTSEGNQQVVRVEGQVQKKMKQKCDMKVKNSKSKLAFELHFFGKCTHLGFRIQ